MHHLSRRHVRGEGRFEGSHNVMHQKIGGKGKGDGGVDASSGAV
jgi:hypothetical protein